MISSLDTETWLFAPGLVAPPMVCGSIADEAKAMLLSKSETIDWYGDKISSKEDLVGQNFVFDLSVLCSADARLIEPTFKALEEGRLHCTSVRQALIDIAEGNLQQHGDDDDERGIRYSLSTLVMRHLGLDITAEKSGPDAWRKRYWELDGIPVEEWPWAARVYPMRDAQFTLDVFFKQEGGLNLHDEPPQMRAAFALQLMSVWGMRTSPTRVAALREKVEAEWTSSRDEFRKVGIFRDDDTKDKKRLGELVSAAYRGEPPMTPKGQVATDRDTLLESGDPVLEKLGKSGKNDKRKSTYLPILERGLHQPWNPNFNVLVATGRVSSDAQQFPKDGGIRECFQPREGFVYCSVDYGGLELRTMSQRAYWELGYSYMMDALNEGLDVHTIVAAQFLGGADYDELLFRVKQKETLANQFRDLGKIFNFGKGGGMGAGAMAYNARSKDNIRFCLTTGLSEYCGDIKEPVWVMRKEKMVCSACIKVSRELGKQWLETWKEQKELATRAGMATNGGFVDVTVPVSNRVRGLCKYTQWLNTPFQGLGADLVKDAMWRVSNEMHTDRDSPLWGSHLCLNVHDELVAELMAEKAPEAAERMAFIMRETAKEWLPDLIPSIEADPAIGLILSKKMSTVRNEGGRLQLWVPQEMR